ncbi:MAG: hypothetical protein IPO67_19055 [Deltaproteobacteria bacterium]|nr:hypothetical protein [Deltaproteobacteria bacterium]
MSAPRPTDRPFHARALLAVGRLIDALSRQFGSEEALFSEFGFLRGYAGFVSDPDEVEDSPGLRALATTLGLTEAGVDALLILGLVEDDGRFGVLFEALQNSPGQHRPSWGLLSQLLGEEVRPALTALLAAGAARVESRDAPRSEWALRVPLSMWDALGGDPTPALEPGMSYSPPGSLARWEDLTLPPGTREEVERLDVIALRGARRSGRRALLGARARAAGRGLIELEGAPDRDRWREAGALATALNADLALRLELAAGEAISLERPAAAPAKVGVILGLTGGISGALAEAAETLRVRAPEPAVRALLWAQHTGSPDVGAALAPRRVGAGMLVCAARAAHRRSGPTLPWPRRGARRALPARRPVP